jgi:hypothetical protein
MRWISKFSRRISRRLTPVAGQKFEDQLAKLCQTNGESSDWSRAKGGGAAAEKRSMDRGGSKTKIFGEGVGEYGMGGRGNGRMTKTK